MPSPERSPVAVAGGPLAAERWVADVARRERPARAEELDRPLRIVVASSAQREHVLARVLESCGGAVAGLRVQTLWSVALETLEAAGRDVRASPLASELAARHESSREPVLRAALSELDDGFGFAAGSISDLLSAGLDLADPAAVDSCLARIDSARERELARGILAAARRTSRALETLGVLRVTDVYARAAAELERDPTSLPSRRVLVHGFADLTGQAARFVRALLARTPCTFVAAEAIDPATGAEPAPSESLVAELVRRLAPRSSRIEGEPDRPASIEAFHAWGERDELREVAARIRADLDRNVAPESIAVVARRLEGRELVLRAVFEEHGIPFSGGSEPRGARAADRRAAAALDVLRQGAAARVEDWLDAIEGPVGELEDVRLALRALGAARLSDAAEIDLEAALRGRDAYELPQRAADDPGRPGRKERRALGARRLRDFVERAKRAREAAAAWPERSSVAGHVAAARAALRVVGAEPEALVRALDELARSCGALEDVGRSEVAGVLEVALRDAKRPALGGAGGGVRILEAQQARGLAFERLYLVGVERGAFPRAAREDPLLGDRARSALRRALPELASLERTGREERHLFRALIASARGVCLSWRRADEDGKPIGPSPFVEALRRKGACGEPAAISRRRDSAPRPGASVAELVRYAALVGPRAGLADALAIGIEDAARRFGGPSDAAEAAELARARLTVLDELDPDLGTAEGRERAKRLGPYLGLVGRAPELAAAPLYVTTLENVARCAWKSFLERVLGLEPALDPVSELLDTDALLLGNAVHAAIGGWIASAAGERRELSDALARGPASVPRPSAAEIGRAITTAARATLAEEGLPWEGFADALARRALPYAERAVEMLWPDGAPLAALGAELSGRARVATFAGALEVAFRADVACEREGALTLIDLKTGKPLSDGKKEDTRRKHLVARIASGENLQAAVYAASTSDGVGAYAFVRPDLRGDLRWAETRADEEVTAALARSVLATQLAWSAGVLVPRVEKPLGKSNELCERCEVASACPRTDSGVRRRIARIGADGEGELDGGDALARFRDLWLLPTKDEEAT